jgi:hypothetical protein
MLAFTTSPQFGQARTRTSTRPWLSLGQRSRSIFMGSPGLGVVGDTRLCLAFARAHIRPEAGARLGLATLVASSPQPTPETRQQVKQTPVHVGAKDTG